MAFFNLENIQLEFIEPDDNASNWRDTLKFYVITSECTLENSWYGIPVYSLSKVAANKAASIIRAREIKNWYVNYLGEKMNS